MKKVLHISFLALSVVLTNKAMASDWYVGAGAGWLSGSASTATEVTNVGAGGAPFQRIRSQLSDTGIMGTVFAGHTFHAKHYDWFIQARGFLDNSAFTETVQFNPATVAVGPASVKLGRTGSLAFDGGLSKSYGLFDVSLQVSAIVSKFDIKFDDIDGRFSTKGSRYAWAIAPGAKIEHNMGMAVIGLGYEYQIYEPVKYGGTDIMQQRLSSVRSAPRYHSMMVTLKKSL